MLFIMQYWRVILVTVVLLGSNYLTYQYVDNKWALKWQEANVDALKSTLELQKGELDKQQQLIEEKSKNEEYYVKENAKLDTAINTLADEYSLLVKTLDSGLPRGEENGGAGVDRTRASEATARVVQAELLRWSVQANAILSEEADKLRLSNETCINEYNSVRKVINGN